MNETQKRYALRRVECTAEEKREKVYETCKLNPKPYSPKQLLADIKAGRVKLNPTWGGNNSVGRYTDVCQVFVLPEPAPTIDQKRHDQLVAVVNKLAQTASDQIMLGDCEEAMKILSQLDAWEPK